MAEVPVYTNQQNIEPTPENPKLAANIGNEIADVGHGLEGMGEAIQKLDDNRQTWKAETYLSKQHLAIRNMAATDPDIDTLDERIDQKSQDAVNEAADLIKNPSAKQDFISKYNAAIEVRNVPLYDTVNRRKSQDAKNQLIQATDADVVDYQSSADPQERAMLRQKIIDRSRKGISDGHINPTWGANHVKTILKNADVQQVQSDMAISATDAYRHLQAGKEGLYPNLTDGQRKSFMDKAQKMIEKEGSDNKLIYSIAQNHTENMMLDKMENNTLTQADISQAATIGNKGITARPEFIKAATEALQDPFPTESVPEKENELYDQIADPDKDAQEVKLNIIRARGVSPSTKAMMINRALREDPSDSTGATHVSISDLIQRGIKNNKEALMQANIDAQKQIDDKRHSIGNIWKGFTDYVGSDIKKMADFKNQFFQQAKGKKTEDLPAVANQITFNDFKKTHPWIAGIPKEGTRRYDGTQWVKVYPDRMPERDDNQNAN